MTMILPQSRIPDTRSAPPVRWGVVGTGWIAELFFEALHKHTRSRLAAVGSRTAEKAADFASRFGADRSYGSYAELVEDTQIDAVYVATPHSEHLDNALLAIAAGKPVLVEKAFTRNVGEAQLVVDAARDAGVPVMEAMWTRFLPHMDVVRQVLDEGLLGEVETLFADHGQWFAEDPEHRLFDPAKAGGAMLDLGVYPVSFANFALGAPSRMAALGSKAFTGVDRQVSAVLGGFSKRTLAQALVSTTLAARTPTTAFIAGSEARLELTGDFYAPGVVTVTSRDGASVSTEEPTIKGHEGLSYEAAHFAQMIADGRTESGLMPLEDTLAVMETMDELRRQVGAVLPGE